MGNHPSTANSNKLSKPKTNTNSTAAALKVDSPASSTTSRYVDLTTEGRQQIKETLLAPIASEVELVPEAHRQDEVAEATVTRGRTWSMISRSNSRTNSRSNSISCFGSKHGSTAKLAGLTDSDLSLGSASQVDLEAAIRLLQQVKKNASPEDLAALHEALEGPDDHAKPLPESSLSRRTSEINRSSSSLMRRQSLIQAPGVGTRRSPVEGRRRTWNSWKAPKLEPEEEAKWRISPRTAARLTTQATMLKPEDNRDVVTPRAQTPGEMDYGQLGNMRGCLRVTNGASSPVPSTIAPLPHEPEDEYFLSTETDSSPLMMKSTRRQQGHVKSKSAVLPAKSPLSGAETHNVHVAHDETPTEDEQAISDLPPLQPQVSPVELESRIPIPKCLRVGSRSEDSSAQNAARFAQSYQAEIPMSPFFGSEDTAKLDQDQTFVSDEVHAIRQDTARMLEGAISAEPEPKTLMNKLPASLTISQNSKGQSYPRPPPYTTDSGYSSGGSLPTVDRDQYKIVVPFTPAELSSSPPRGVRSPELATPKSILLNSTAQPVELPATKDLAEGVYVTASQTSLPMAAKTSPADRRPSALSLTDCSAKSSANSSMSELVQSPLTPQSATSKSSSDSTSSTKPKRLQRRRPAQAEAPVIQSCQPIPEGTIPEVPMNVRAKFERRLSHTPGVECLTHTYPSKDHTAVEEPAAGDRFPKQTEFTQLAELELAKPPTPSVEPRRRSMSIFRRKSTVESKDVEKEAQQTSLDVAHLGIIASSLGSSPYDAAMARKSNDTTASATHPHQFGNSLPRRKSMASMDSKAAAEFARAHSRDLAVTEQEKSQQRRRSHHNLSIDAGEAMASKRRPKVSDIPPVPSIDMSKLPSPLTAMPRLGNEVRGNPKAEVSTSGPRKQRQRMSEIVGKYDASEQKPLEPGVNWEAHSHAWSQRRKSIGEGLREKEVVTVNTSSANPVPQHRASEDVPGWGRYSGGLQYEYQGRGVGIGGSSGMRELHSLASPKSTHFKHSYGVDLSDVPIIIQRM